jgi:acyl-CoA thioester hydrolase
MDGFPHVRRETVRFRDIDAFGHVNNAVYLTYVEQARIEFLIELGLTEGIEDVRILVARIEIDYRSRLGFGDEVEVGTRCDGVGRTSFELGHEVRAGERLAAQARTVLVCFDYDLGAPRPVPNAWRAALAPG